MTALILVADDDPFNRDLLEDVCTIAGFRTRAAPDGIAAMEQVTIEKPDVVLLDLYMPGMDGFRVLEAIKGDAALARISVIVVTAAGDHDARQRAHELGADDFVTKPFRVFEIHQRIRGALQRSAGTRQAVDADVIDPLTRAGTSRQLLVTLDYEFARADRYGHTLACLVTEIVGYRELVDARGREVAEGILVQFANGLRSCIRSVDHLFRSDLAEFVLLLPETGNEGAESVLERVRARATDGSLFAANLDARPEVRLGLAIHPHAEARTADSFLRVALASLNAPRTRA